ncbi:serine protease 3-like [Amyelois transitella]|uniref:serine protease 3-like n=1 Tax=Amyelois transitella TaxID=680683 RepID=UPI00067D489A|nr:serine protease 3-like [Amyelois transitella]
MKTACIVLSLLILVAIMAVCVMVKFATDINVEEKKRDYLFNSNVYSFTRSMGVINLKDNSSSDNFERFPYVAAITRNSSSTWTFACFASVILTKWVITAAHCRTRGATHRVLLYYDLSTNRSQTYPILIWRLYEKFNYSSRGKYDIAVAKLNVDYYPFNMRPAVFDNKFVPALIQASIWRTVSTMHKKLFLTDDFTTYDLKIADGIKCIEAYGVDLDESLICVDLSNYDDCFIHEFGPIFYGDKIVGVLTERPRDCDNKYAIFTNVSYYSDWILKSTHTTFYG